MSSPEALLLSTLQNVISFQSSATASISKEVTICKVLELIKNGEYASQVTTLRELLSSNKTNEYNTDKKKLPAVTFCGTFESRRKKELIKNYNSLLVIDIDKLNNLELEATREILKTDLFVFSYWNSPSNKGLKGLILLSYDNLEDINNFHKRAFRQVSDYFTDNYSINIDESGSDTTRLCFLSFDPMLETKSTIHPFLISNSSSIDEIKKKVNITQNARIWSTKDRLFNPAGKNIPRYRRRMQLIIKFLSKRKLSITSDYQSWIRVAFALATSFTYEVGEKYFLALSKLDESKFNELHCKNILIYCYEHNDEKINFTTIIYLAQRKGYLFPGIRGGNSTEGGAPKEPRKFQHR